MSHAPLTARGTGTRSLLALLVCCALMFACVTQAMGATVQVDWSPQAALTDVTGTPTVAATVEQCVTTGEQVDRSATFSGEMTAVAGAARMAMRIEVQERMPGEELFHTVSAPGLGVWRGSALGVKIYQYVKQVTNLSSPAIYRALVRFHWLDDKGQVIRRAERHTPKCAQPASPVAPVPPVSVTPGSSTSGSTSPSTTG
jgi:hypothetical protein